MNGGNEQAGTIYYDAVIETKRLKVTAAEAERIVKGSVGNSDKATAVAGKNMTSSLNGVAQSLAIVGTGYLALRTATGFLKQSIADANRYQMSMAGLASVAQAFGQDTAASLQAAKDLAADGLIPLAESTRAFKTALASGFTLQQATVLLAGLKDQAVNNRQSFYDLGGAVNATLEGIKNGNSVLADATGTTKNLSVIAKEAGISVDEMGSVASNTAYRTAILNSFLQEAARSSGDAARYADTAAGADARLSTAMTNLRITAGQMANEIRGNLVDSLGQFINANQGSIIAIGAGVTAFITVITVVPLVVRAIRAVITAIRAMTLAQAVATGGVSLLATALGVVAAIAAGKAFDKTVGNFSDMEQSTDHINRNVQPVPGNLSKASKEAANLAKQLRKIDEQIALTNRDFNEQLAELLKNKNESIAQLKDQLQEERAQYAKSYSDRLFDFNKTQQDEADSHQDKVKALQTQIDFLSRYNNAANRRRLGELQFALAKENAEYDKRNKERVAKYALDEEAERLSHEKKQSELEMRLNAETALLEKHRADLDSIRNLILLDEIEKLKRSRDEQLKSLQEQKRDAIENAKDASNQIADAFTTGLNKVSNPIKVVNDTFGQLDLHLNGIKNNFIQITDSAEKLQRAGSSKAFQDTIKSLNLQGGTPYLQGGRAAGGPVSAGSSYLVGENPDGSINRTSEIFVPNRSGTIIPSSDLQAALGGGPNVSVTLNMAGIMSSGPSDERAIAQRMLARINEGLRAKGVAQLGTA